MSDLRMESSWDKLERKGREQAGPEKKPKPRNRVIQSVAWPDPTRLSGIYL